MTTTQSALIGTPSTERYQQRYTEALKATILPSDEVSWGESAQTWALLAIADAVMLLREAVRTQ